MKTIRISSLFLVAAAAIGFAACSDSPTSSDHSIYDDATVTLDLASSAGDAAASLVSQMAANEVAAGATTNLAVPANTDVAASRTCYDATNTVVANCSPFSSVRKVVTAFSVNTTRSASRATTGGGTTTWTGTVHRASDDTTLRVFSGSLETSRVHADVATSHDTTTFTDETMTRVVAENARDSVKNVTFTLPHSSNPYPTAGSIVRVDTVHVAVSKAGISVSKNIVRTVTVAFPADADGNVTLTVNAKSCLLNLKSHAVTGCH